MGHYELLGVAPDALLDEIKHNYLALVRRSHPDLHRSSEASRLAGEERMRLLNEAWAVLSNVDQRSVYDSHRTAVTPEAPAVVEEAFHPFDDDGDDDVFDPRHDIPITQSALPQWLALAPALLLFGGLGGLFIGSLFGAIAVVVLGFLSVTFSAVLFFVAPIVALSRAARDERLG